jgi:hypothetical protein
VFFLATIEVPLVGGNAGRLGFWIARRQQLKVAFQGGFSGWGVAMRWVVLAVFVPVMAVASGAKFPAGEKFSSAAAAAAHCPADVVVWSTFSKSKAFHTAASRYYGKTKHGAYVCEKDALAAGFHAAKS